MDQVQRVLRFIFFSVWAVFMTALTYILGAPSLKVLRRRLGRAKYWALCTLISMGLVGIHAKLLAVAFFSLVVLMGVFDEFEEMEFTFQVSAFFTLLINSLIAGGAFAIWVFATGPNWSQTVLTGIENTLKPLGDLNSRLQVNSFDLMVQLPSIAIIMWMIAIYVAVLLEARLSTGDLATETKVPSLRPQLATFRLPDALVWIFIASILGTFGGFSSHALEAIAVNAMNVCVVLFFFQGIAVVTRFFETLRLGPFWQFLFMVVIVVQLFLFVSLLGLLDYWLDFRSRMTKRAEGFNREA
ncbi:MAG: DUF2232 domain-containing protein [Bdellovibrionales bacterium]